jgi:hypothetical protein
VAAGDGSSAPDPNATAAVGMAAMTLIGSSTGASSSQPQVGESSTMAVAGDDIVGEPEVVHGHPLLRAPWDISLDEAMGTTHWALHQAQEVLHREHDGVNVKHRRVLLWASMLKGRMTSERARAQA